MQRKRLKLNKDAQVVDDISKDVAEFVNGETTNSFRDRLPDSLESKELLRGVNGRSWRGRQMKETFHVLVTDLGGIDTVSFAEAETARRCAALSVIAAEMETNLTLYNDESFNLDDYLLVARAQNQLFKSLGMKRRARNVNSNATSLDSYLLRKQGKK